MNQKPAAIWCRRHAFDEHAVDGAVVCQSKVQGSLNLPAELLGLALSLPGRRPDAGIVLTQSFHELRVYNLYFL